MSQIGVGLVGSGFVSTIHFESLQAVADARVVAVASPAEAHVRDFAESHGIPR
jgi:predicted dehydrogenase